VLSRGRIAQLVWRLSYGLNDADSGVRFPAGAGKFSVLHPIQTGSGAHSAFYIMGTGGSFPVKGGERPGRETDHSPHSSADVKKAWRCGAIPPHPNMSSWRVKHTDNFTFRQSGIIFIVPFWLRTELLRMSGRV
jgi:hypothetical protein